MMTETTEKQAPKPEDDGYSKRIEALRAKRRERGTAYTAAKNLSVDTSKLDPRFEYRWVNEQNMAHRQAEATFLGDWELVPNKKGEMDDGRNVEQKASIARIVERGIGKRAYLMRKPKELYADDQQSKLEPIAKQESEMRRNGVAPGLKTEGGEDSSQIYTPRQVASAYKP